SPGGANAEQKVKMPAMALLATTAAFMLIQLVLFIFAPAMLSGMTDFVNKMAAEQAAKSGTEPPPKIDTSEASRGWCTFIFQMVGGGFIIFGALKMMKLQSWGIALAASILAIIPCTSPCCCTGLPIGIWAIVVLVNSDVKAAFR